MIKQSSEHIRPGLSHAVEDYLRKIWLIEKGGERVTTHSLAAQLDVSIPSATQMAHRLAALGPIVYEPYGPISRTDAGCSVRRGRAL